MVMESQEYRAREKRAFERELRQESAECEQACY